MGDALPEDGERAKIVAVIEAETAAWLAGDVAGWAACWVQDARAQHVNARPSVGARILQGFEAVLGYMAPIIERMPEDGLAPGDIRRENWRISVGADMAWATFDQLVPLGSGPDAAPGRHNQMRILEKVGGAWKIAAVFQIPNRIGYYTSPWLRVDARARILETGAGAGAALASHAALQAVGNRLCGRTAAADARLRAALAEADALIARREGRAPVALVLGDSDDISVSLAWVTISDMMIVVLLGDGALLAQRIAKAGEVYRLTRAQMRVAEAIARGNDLKRAAGLLGVRPNTVRTHVRRMFDKVGANAQPALIRALLTVEAPRP